MKKFLFTFIVSLFTLSGTLHANEEARAQHIFIISFDQAAPAGIEKAKMPIFKQMAAEGAHTWEAYTIVPSWTLPSHTSMLTGVGIQKHQVDWNNYDRDKGKVEVPTIFSIAKEEGFVTAMYVAKQKFEHLNLPSSLDKFDYSKDREDCGAIAAEFAQDVAELQPNLCFIHFGDPDVQGHKYGVWSPEKMQAYEDTDAALKVIRDAVEEAGILEDSVFILTSDHGGHDFTDKNGITRGTHGTSLPDDVIIPWVAWGKGVKSEFTITAPVVQYDTAATALWLLDIPVPQGFWGRPVISAFED